MYPTFDRFRLDYDSEYERWLNRKEPDAPAYRAMARNVMHDPRVSEPRETRFEEHRQTAKSLENALSTYFSTYVRDKDPDFLDDSLNLLNIVAGALKANFIDHDVELVTFLDLTGLTPIYKWAKEHPDPDYDDVFDWYTSDTTDSAGGGWLEKTIRLLGAGVVMRAVLAARKAARADPKFARHNPVWAGLWAELERSVKDHPPDRWTQLVGVHKSVANRWIAPFRYTVFEAGTLVRPCVLDAGFYSSHFPSPRDAPVQDGGCCMDLAVTDTTKTLVHEYIHQEIDFTVEYWEAAGSRCSPTAEASPDDIVQQRRTHYGLLNIGYPGVASWMQECV